MGSGEDILGGEAWDRPELPLSRLEPVGVLAIQGSFLLHMQCLRKLGVSCVPVRKPADLKRISALILPGGESTVMSLLMQKYALFEPVRDLGTRGLPMLGTCAGAILLGQGAGTPLRLGLAPVELRRNAYGTQIDSFTAFLRLTPFSRPFQGIFIRAPRIVRLLFPSSDERPRNVALVPGPRDGDHGMAQAEPICLGEHDGSPVLVSARNLLLATFHPELTDDLRIHEYFLRRFVLRSVAAVAVASSR